MNINTALIDKFLEAVFPLPEHFGMIDTPEGDFLPVDYEEFYNAVSSVDSEAIVNFGMTKIVIYSPSLNGVVIKIPFNGVFDIYDEEEDFRYFENAGASDTSDYCLAEYEKYKALYLQGLECFLARTMFYTKKDNVRVFLQEEIREYSSFDLKRKKIHASIESKELAKTIIHRSRKCPFHREWLEDCIEVYGFEKVQDFMCYCENVDNEITQDMHSGNYGYRPNGLPAILDFSGYYD